VPITYVLLGETNFIYYQGDEIKEDEFGGSCNKHVRDEKYI